jgi:hypothetical protein
MGIDTDRMEAFFENPSPPSDQVETVASETGDLLDRIIDTQERNTIQTAQTAPLVPSGGGRSVAERVAEQEGRVVEYPKTPQEIVLLPDQILIDLARGTGKGRQTESSRIAVDWIRERATGMTAEEFLEREQRRGEERRERTSEVARRVSKKLRQRARKQLKAGGK